MTDYFRSLSHSVHYQPRTTSRNSSSLSARRLFTAAVSEAKVWRSASMLSLLCLITFSSIWPSVSASGLSSVKISFLQEEILAPKDSFPAIEAIISDVRRTAPWTTAPEYVAGFVSEINGDNDLSTRSAEESLNLFSISVRRRDASPMPRPFDSDLGTNFTSQSCPKFFKEFLANTTVMACHSVSMLLENSAAFFQILKSTVELSSTLDVTCAVSESRCSRIMSHLASRLLKDDACGHDYRLGNPLVQGAYASMVAYSPVYRASCLINPATGDFCFVDAVSNSSNPNDYNVYFIPLGIPLTGSEYPTCNECLQATLTTYSQFAQQNGQPLDDTYLLSAQLINQACGANFANTSIVVGDARVISGTARLLKSVKLIGCLLALAIGFLLF